MTMLGGELRREMDKLSRMGVCVAIGLLKASCKQKFCSVLSVVVVLVGGSANGGRDEKMFDF